VLAAEQHVTSVQACLRDVAPPEARLARLAADQQRVERLLADANAIFVVPNLVVVSMAFVTTLRIALQIVAASGVAGSPAGQVVSVVVILLLSGAAALLLRGLASVHDAYEECADALKHDLALINRAEEVFPGNGAAYLSLLQTDLVLGFEFLRMPMNGRLLMSSAGSLFLAVLATLFLEAMA
jgi:hypothetical protein